MALTGKQVQGIIRTHKSKSRSERQDWDRWRSWYMSEYWNQSHEGPTGSAPVGNSNGDEGVNFETNYPYAFIDTMIANICPQNPQVTVTARRDKLRGAAKFRGSNHQRYVPSKQLAHLAMEDLYKHFHLRTSVPQSSVELSQGHAGNVLGGPPICFLRHVCRKV